MRLSRSLFGAMMENLLSMAVIATAIFLSKRNTIPIIIFSYYAIYLGWLYAFGGIYESSFSYETVNLASIYYLGATSISLLVIIPLCLNAQNYRNITIFYAIMVFISMVFNAIQAFSMTIESNWFIDFYTIRQQIAIPLDITVAWLGSDNFVSRRLGVTRDSDNIDSNAANRFRAN
jgi:hypothetical protein